MKKYTLKHKDDFIQGILVKDGYVSIEYGTEPKVLHSQKEAEEMLQTLQINSDKFGKCQILPVNVVKK